MKHETHDPAVGDGTQRLRVDAEKRGVVRKKLPAHGKEDRESARQQQHQRCDGQQWTAIADQLADKSALSVDLLSAPHAGTPH